MPLQQSRLVLWLKYDGDDGEEYVAAAGLL